jgi:hypothetical protein
MMSSHGKRAEWHLIEERGASQGCSPGMPVSIDDFDRIWHGSENLHRYAGMARANEMLGRQHGARPMHAAGGIETAGMSLALKMHPKARPADCLR